MTDPSNTGSEGSLQTKAQHAFETSRDSAREAARRTAEGIESNPLGVLVGGLAVGVLAAALIPKTDKERELLAPVGKRISTAATAALVAAKDNLQSELSARGLSKDGLKDQASSLFEGVSQAVTTAGTAAADAAKQGAAQA